jgi:sulfate adenylyltransferase subunit 2
MRVAPVTAVVGTPPAVETPAEATARPSARRAAYRLDHLDHLEAEAIHVVREVAGQFERPVILFSGGKDSVVMLHLAVKAFAPSPLPFALLHVDTGHNFPELLDYRDATVARLGVRLVVASVQDYIDDGRLRSAPTGRATLQTVPLLDAISGTASTPCSAAGDDDEKARAKERLSIRDAFGA